MADGPLTLDELYPPHPGEGTGTPEELDRAARAQADALFQQLGPNDNWDAASGRQPLTLDEVMGQPAQSAPVVPLTADELMAPSQSAPAEPIGPPAAPPQPSYPPDISSELTAQFGPTGPQAQFPPEYSPAFAAAHKARMAKLLELKTAFDASKAAMQQRLQAAGPPTIDPTTGMQVDQGDIGQAPPPYEQDTTGAQQQADIAAKAAMENQLVSTEATSRGMDPGALTANQRRMLLGGATTRIRRAGLMAPGTEPQAESFMRPAPEELPGMQMQGDPLRQDFSAEQLARMPSSEVEGLRTRMGMEGPPPVSRRIMTPAEDVGFGVVGGATGITPEAIARLSGATGQPLQIEDPGLAARRSFEMGGEFLPIGGLARMTRTAPAIVRVLAMSAPGAVREGLRGGVQAGAEQFAAGALMFGPMEIGGAVAEAALGSSAARLADQISTAHPYFASGVRYSPAVIGKSGGILLSPALQGRDVTLDDVAWSLLPVLEAAGTIHAVGGNVAAEVARIKEELARAYPVGPGETVTVGDMKFGDLGRAYREHLAGQQEQARRDYAQNGPPTGPEAAPAEPTRAGLGPGEEPPAGPAQPEPPPEHPSGQPEERRTDAETAQALEKLSPEERAAVLGREDLRAGGRAEPPPAEPAPPPEAPAPTERRAKAAIPPDEMARIVVEARPEELKNTLTRLEEAGKSDAEIAQSEEWKVATGYEGLRAGDAEARAKAVGLARSYEIPPTPMKPGSSGPAPVVYKGRQEGVKTKKTEVPAADYWDLTQDIPGHPKGSTVSTDTLTKAGYDVPEPPEFFPSYHPKTGWRVVTKAGEEVMPFSDQESAKIFADQLNKKHGKPASPPSPTSHEPPPAAEKPGQAMSFPTQDIHTAPERFQFKLAHGPSGETGSLTGTGKYSPVLAGAIQVWRDPQDGKVYVINGHNRHARAVAANAPTENVIFVDAKNAPEARAVGALTNIAEGRGTALDAGKFFRDSGMTMEQLRAEGLKLTERVAEDGLSLSRLAPHLFTEAATGALDLKQAVAIGARLEDHALQGSLVAMIRKAEQGGRKIDTGTVQELADMVASAPKGEAQATLFGTTEGPALAIEKAAVLAETRRRLSREKRLLSTVSKADAAKILSRVGNIIDPEASGAAGDQAAAILAVFDKLKNKVGPIGDAINAVAREVGAGRNVKGSVERAYPDIVRTLEQALRGGGPPSGPPSGPVGPAGERAPQGPRGGGQPPVEGGAGEQPAGGHGPVAEQRVERQLAGLGKPDPLSLLGDTSYPIVRGRDIIGRLFVEPNTNFHELPGMGEMTRRELTLEATSSPHGKVALDRDDWQRILERIAGDFPDADLVSGVPKGMSRDLAEYRKQQGLAFAKVEREGKTYATAAGGGRRALEIFRQNYRGDAGSTTIREAMQNAVDALRALPANRGGGVTVNVDGPSRQITIHDTGVGMTPETVASSLVELEESHKPGQGSSGGFGLAKAAIFGNADNIVVETVADRPTLDGPRTKTTVTGTGEDWMDPNKGLEMREEGTSDSIGTTIQVRMAENVQVGYTAQLTLDKILRYWRIPHAIGAVFNGYKMGTKPAELDHITTLDYMPGATADVLASKATTEGNSIEYHVLNNGLYQFSKGVYLDHPVEHPTHIVIDVHPTGAPTGDKYPFTLDRDALRESQQKVVSDYLKNKFIAEANKRESAKYKAAWDDAPRIGNWRVVDATGDLDTLAKEIAADPHVKAVTSALSNAFDRMKSKLAQRDSRYSSATFGGIGITDKWYGISLANRIIQGKSLSPSSAGAARGEARTILSQPFLLASKALAAEAQRSLVGEPQPGGDMFPYSEDEAARYLAAEIVENAIHELVHQIADHEDDVAFVNAFQSAHAELAPIYTDLVRQLATVVQMPGVRRTLEKYHDQITGAIRATGARDFLGKVGSEHAAKPPGKPGNGPAHPGTGGAGGAGPPGNIPPGQGAAGTGGVPPSSPGPSAPRKYQPRAPNYDAAERALQDVLQRIGRVADQERGQETKIPARGKFEFSRDTLEKEWNEAHGLPPEKRFERMREEAKVIYDKMTRQFHTLPNGPQFEPLRFALTNFMKRWPIADKTARRMEEYIVGPLDRTGLDVFDRKVLFESLQESIALHDKAVAEMARSKTPMSESDRAAFQTPFGLTAKEVRRELGRINAWIATHGRDDVVKALQRRREVWPALQDALYWAHKENGHDIGPKLLRDEYARHQVLDKAVANYSAGMGEKIARLKGAERATYLRRRRGTTMALNTDYLQAEFEVMRSILSDIQKERLIGLVDKRYNIIDELKAEAARMNHAAIFEYLMHIAPQQSMFGPAGPGGPRQFAEKVMRSLNQKQAMAFEAFGQDAYDGNLPDGGGEWKDVVDALAKMHTGTKLPDEIYPRLFKYAGWLLKRRNGAEGKMASATLFRGIAEKRRFIERNLERARAMGINREGFVRWNDLVPDSHQEMAVRSSLRTFTTYSVPEQISRPLLEGLKETLGLTAKDLRRIRALGAAEEPLVVPNEVAVTLNDLGQNTQDTQVGKIIATANGYMKEWFLLTFHRLLKSGLRNLSGDADALFVGNPHAFLRAPRAAAEMWNALVREHMPQGDAFEYFQRGGLQSTLQSTELPEVPVAKEFQKFLPPKSVAKQAAAMPVTVWKKYWELARLSMDYRESILRYAAFLDYLEQMRRSPTGEPDNWGASYAPNVMALTNIHDRAYLLSNELMGAYDSVTHFDRFAARQLIPFWRFQAINLRRYPALARNAAYDRAAGATLGRKAVFTAARAPLIAMRLGWRIFNMAAFMAAVMAINLLWFRDEEEELPPEVRNRMHIVLGRDHEGNVIAFTRLGAIQDFLEWFGADTPWQTVQDMMSGRSKEALKDMAWAPVNKLVAGFHPFYKALAELPSRKTFFPDVRRPGRVRDVGLYMARQLAIEPEYKKMMGLPMRGDFKDSLIDSIVYRYNPAESAYYETLDNVYRYKKDVLGRVDDIGGMLDPKSSALYWWRYAVKVGDRVAEEKFRNEYFAAGGSDQGLEKSFQTLHPLYGLKQGKMVKGMYVPGETDSFVDQMTPAEHRKYDRAIAYFETLGGVASEEPPQEDAAASE